MDYYLYISVRKLETLAPQLRPALWARLKGEFGFNLGGLMAKLVSDASHVTLVRQLERVMRQLESDSLIGSMRSGSPWIRDRLRVRHVCFEDNRDIFMLVGQYEGRVCLLAGSAVHMIGGGIAEVSGTSYSYLPFLSRVLLETIEGAARRAENPGAAEIYNKLAGDDEFVPGVADDQLADAVRSLLDNARGVEFEVDFAARPLFKANAYDGQSVSIFSPLYVCQVPPGENRTLAADEASSTTRR